jgi:hypothetical protein
VDNKTSALDALDPLLNGTRLYSLALAGKEEHNAAAINNVNVRRERLSNPDVSI